VTEFPDLAAFVDQLPADRLPEVIGRLAAAQARALARLTTPSREETRVSASDRAALDVAEVSRRTGMSVPSLYRQARAGHLPFARRIGRTASASAEADGGVAEVDAVLPAVVAPNLHGSTPRRAR
jgi:predicted DNA-binding transcriptional regulator AlpA